MRHYLVLVRSADSSDLEIIEYAARAARDAAGRENSTETVLAVGLDVNGPMARVVEFPSRNAEPDGCDPDDIPPDDLPGDKLRDTARTRRAIKRAQKAFYLMELFPEGATILAAYGDGEQDKGYAAALDYADSIADGETVVLGLDVDSDGSLAVERLVQNE